MPRPVKELDRGRHARRRSTHAPGAPSDTAGNQARPARYSPHGPHTRIRTITLCTRLRNQQDSPRIDTAPGLVCGPCGTELPPNAKSYNQSAVPSYRVRWTDSPPHLAAALTGFLVFHPHLLRHTFATRWKAAVDR